MTKDKQPLSNNLLATGYRLLANNLNLLKLWAVVALGLYLSAYIRPADLLWGAQSLAVLPPWLGLTLVVPALCLLVPAWNERALIGLRRLWAALPGQNHPRRRAFALAIAAGPVFWLLRIRHLNWGDANILVVGLSQTEGPVLYNWQAPFTVFLHQRLWALVAHPWWGWGVETVYAAVSVFCGVIFVYVVLRLAHLLGQTAAERIAVAGLILTCGSMQLFFGYVENYTVISLAMMGFLWAGIKCLRGEAPLWWATLALSLANAFHPSTVVLWPAALYLAWRRGQTGGFSAGLWLELLLPPLLIANSVITLMELGNHGLAAFLGDDRPGGGDHIWFVPLQMEATTEWQRYTMFSAAHWLDWANEQFLTSAFGLVILLIGGGWAWRTRTAIGARGRFLGLASLMYLLLTFAWNADYGIRKDWDLFSPAAFVYSIPAALALIAMFRGKPALAQATLIILAVSGLGTATWVLSNAMAVAGP